MLLEEIAVQQSSRVGTNQATQPNIHGVEEKLATNYNACLPCLANEQSNQLLLRYE